MLEMIYRIFRNEHLFTQWKHEPASALRRRKRAMSSVSPPSLHQQREDDEEVKEDDEEVKADNDKMKEDNELEEDKVKEENESEEDEEKKENSE